jgi:hypothetical protein
MSNFTVTLEVKFAPELMLVLNSLIAASQPKTSAIQAPVNFNTPAPTQPAIKGLENYGPVTGQNPAAPRPSAPVQQYAPAPQYTAPVAPQAPQYIAPVQQAPVNPTQAMPANNMALPAKPAAVPNAPMSFPSNPAPQSQTAPTSQAPAFAYDDLARAASSLMDAGKQQQLLGLISQFGVPALTQLPKEQYGAFATALRQMGARI